MRWKAVAWDIDGTLVDSEDLHHRALVHTCATYGLDLSALSDRAFEGVHMLDVWSSLRSRLPRGLDRDVWLAAIDRLYIEQANTVVVSPHARETIRALHARGVAQACVSNSSRRVVDANIAALGLGGLIAFTVSLDDVVAGKPDPEPFLQATKRLGLTGAQALAVEDSAAGAASAQAAGLFVVRYDPAGQRAGPGDLWLGDLSEILGLFEPL